jgi:O-methyltransferase
VAGTDAGPAGDAYNRIRRRRGSGASGTPAVDNTFILKLQRGTGRKAGPGIRLAARLIKLFNTHSRHLALKFKRDDFNRYFGIKYSRFDPYENLLLGGMISVEQAVNLYHLLGQVLVMDVAGDVVELGCYEGTTGIILQTTLDQYGSDKQLHLYDSFQGLPDRAPEDGDTRFQAGDCKIGIDGLVRNFERFGVRLPEIHPGWFRDTLPAQLPDRIAFAHLDGDFYTSVRESLEHVYPRLAKSAIVVVDDYCDPTILDVNNHLPGVKRACDDFLRDKAESMSVLLGGCVTHGYFRKL